MGSSGKDGRDPSRPAVLKVWVLGVPETLANVCKVKTVQVIRIFSVSLIFILSQVYRVIFQRLCDVTWNACLCILRV